MSKIDTLLAGFESVETDGHPFITIIADGRISITKSARLMLGIAPYDTVDVRYNPIERELALITPAIDRASTFTVDKRYYLSARRFCRERGYVASPPYHFDYVRGANEVKGDSSVFIFRLRPSREVIARLAP